MKFSNRRECAGPRGGRVILPTPCSECVAYRTCAPGAISEPWGCESWVDDGGRRAMPELIDREPDRDPTIRVEVFQGREVEYVRMPDLREPGPDPDAGPLFGGRS